MGGGGIQTGMTYQKAKNLLVEKKGNEAKKARAVKQETQGARARTKK